MEEYLNEILKRQAPGGAFCGGDGKESALETSLILSCLGRLPGTSALPGARRAAAGWLLGQKNNGWTFAENACADFIILAAIAEYDRGLVDGAGLGKILINLASLEAREGGPYHSSAREKTVDPGTNIAIAYFLSLYDVDLPSLDDLIGKTVESQKPESGFFNGGLPLVYILSKFLKEKARESLAEHILEKKRNGFWNSGFENVLAVSSLLRLGREKENLAAEIECLRDGIGGWEDDFSFFSGKTGTPGGLARETMMAFYLEARELAGLGSGSARGTEAAAAASNTGEARMIENILQVAEQRFIGLPEEMKISAMREIKRTISGNPDRQMPLMPFYLKQALGKKGNRVTDPMVAKMGLANIFFWTAFIVYDDFWDCDEAADPRLLPVANLFARDYTSYFVTLLPPDTGFPDFFRELMDRLDAANAWETSSCRAAVGGTSFHIPENIPDYGDYSQKFWPAAGHILGPVAMLLFSGYGLESAETKNLVSYFRNYLIAMQINDDMHDWVEDMRRGHLSTAVAMLLKDWLEEHPGGKKIDLEADLKELQRLFWFKTMARMCGIAVEFSQKSKHALRAMTILENTAPLSRFADNNENAAKKALAERKKSLDFLDVFKD